MRFLPEGPNIPDELLEERDNGKVVFLCGAGVSYPAGMPDFEGLARFVVEELGTPRDAPSWDMLSRWQDESVPAGARPSVDQIFNLLQQEYAAGEIDYLIAKKLKTPRGANLAAHETILRLSRSSDGKAQIVTTNFDLLFEKAAQRKLNTHVAPALPDLAGMQSFDGIAYLHGRIDYRIKRGEGRQDLVVSSSDFGRAYLAEGWATRFVRALLDRYIVILLGYSASDPPVRYLLQGLYARRQGRGVKLFAFDSGAEEEVQYRWRDSGVHALAYPSADGHAALWGTLSAWAERADNPSAWRQKVVALARRGPRNLSPHERGHVASLVRTDVGAKLFADADPSPPGEWLCVFDHYVRYGDVGGDFTGTQPDFDPLIEYGLDDDPPRSSENVTHTKPPGDDLLSLRSRDPPTDSGSPLPNLRGESTMALPSKLARLVGWIVKVVPEPVTAWWVARCWTLHPNLLNLIELHLEQIHEGLPPLARSTWRLLIEKLLTSAEYGDPDHAWYWCLRRINAEGWTDSVLRAFVRAGEPYLTTRRPAGLNGARPPGDDWSRLHRTDVTEFDVGFPGIRHDRPNVPDEFLSPVYQSVRRHLTLAAELLTAIERQQYFKTLTFYPEDRPGETYLDNRSAVLFWFRELFDRMVELHPEQLRADIVLWPAECPSFFDKLRLYAWTSESLFSGKDVGEGLLAFSDRAFWTTQYHRELLHLLRLRWYHLPVNKRRLLERRLADGPAKNERESEERYRGRRTSEAATNLGWLANNGCELSKKTLATLQRLRRLLPDWRPEWDRGADESYDGRGGNIRTESDPTQIVNAPLDEIIPLATQYTRSSFSDFTDYRPFDGLVKQRPRKAVAALTQEARKGNYPITFWGSALREWPDETSSRLVWLFFERLVRLPSNVVAELGSLLFPWLGNRFLDLAIRDRTRALRLFDMLLDKLFGSGPATTTSGLGGDLYVAGHRQHRSRRTIEHAINGPVGEATKLLLALLDANEPKAASRIPEDLKSRLERLMEAPGEGSDHAICIIARTLRRLDYVDPDWTRTTVLPWFNPNNPAAEPAWSGYLVDNQLPAPPLFSLLKPHFLAAFGHVSEWNWVDQGFLRLHDFLLIGCFKHRRNAAYISYEEARHALQLTDDKGRAHCINCLNRVVLDGNRTKWRRFGKPFLNQAWPQEDRFRTEETSQEFARLAENARDFFPEVVETILPYLVPISGEGLFAYPLTRASNDEGDVLATRFPEATLALINKLVPENPSQIPYKLDTVLELIAEAKPSLRRDVHWRRLNDVVLKR